MGFAIGGFMSDIIFVKGDKKANYTVLDNTCIRDTNISWAAKGLHCYLEHLPGYWKIYKSYLIRNFPNKHYALNNIIKELVEAGYITINEQKRNANGTFGPISYTVFEKPVNNQNQLTVADNSTTVNSTTDNSTAVNPSADNQHLLITNISNTNIQRTKLTNLAKAGESRFAYIIKELFDGYYPFDKTFETRVTQFVSENGLHEDNHEAYLTYVYERTKLGNVKKSFEGLYRTLALSKSIIRDFKNSSFFKKTEVTIHSESNLKYFDCPICSSHFDAGGRCPKCDLSPAQLKDNSLPEYIANQTIYNMSEDERALYESALEERRKQHKILKKTPVLTPSEKIQFWKDYGLIN